jgi:VWFA-related protein
MSAGRRCFEYGRGRGLHGLLFLAILSTSAFAQDAPAPGQSSAPPKELVRRPPEDQAAAEPSTRNVRRISLNVVVTDASGNPAAGLPQSDFTVLDNRQPSNILSFHGVGVGSGAAPDPVQVVLIVDMVNTSFQDVATQRDQIGKFLGQNGGSLPLPVSIVFFSDTGVKVAPPSRDGNALIADMKALATPIRTITSAMGGQGAVERFQLSLKTLSSLTAYEAKKPGRKLLIWIGPGWPMLTNLRFQPAAGDKPAYWDSTVSFATHLREARTILYSISPVGSAASVSREFEYKSYLKPVTAMEQADSADLALPVLAIQSGGRALSGSNDLTGEIATCVAEANAFYTIQIETAPSERANQYHQLDVKIGTTGLTARTNAGYYAQP